MQKIDQKLALTADVIYAGYVRTLPNGSAEAIIKRNPTYFSVHGYRDPVAAATEEQHRLSDELGLTKRRRSVPLNIQQYIAGFLDGDGCISPHKSKAGEKISVTVRVRFSQAQNCGNPLILEYIRNFYGGVLSNNIARRNRPGRENERIQHELMFGSCDATWMLMDMRDKLVVKKRQAEVALALISQRNREEILSLANELSRLKKLDVLNDNDIGYSDTRLTNAYIAGLMDAEGCIQVVSDCKSVKVQITQKSCTNLLLAIKDRLQLPKSYIGKKFSVNFYSTSAMQFLYMVKDYLVTKREQADLAIYFNTKASATERDEIRKKLPVLKRI